MDYKKIYKQAAVQGGWFKNKLDTETKWGDFYKFIKKRLLGNETILDIGTAEGNRFLSLAPYIKKGIGIDSEPAMIELAKKNKRRQGIKNITFKCMNSNRLNFSVASFDVISSRHAPVNFKELYRVLKPGGWFITQQVHETDKLNLKQAFNRGQGYSRKPGALLEQYKKEAKQAGFKSIESKISNVSYYFTSRKALIAFLNKTPTIPDFGSDSDYKILEKFIQNYKSSRGIKSNSSRFLLRMKK